MSSPARPTVFVGSSSEGLPIAKALQLNLEECAEMILWTQGVFGLSQGTLEELVNRLPDYDFAILVLTPDDMTEARGVNSPSPRDNVIFELGLFIGFLGRKRTYIVHERGINIKLPSDLAGVSTATFQKPNRGTLEASLGACSTKIQHAIMEHGTRTPLQQTTSITTGVSNSAPPPHEPSKEKSPAYSLTLNSDAQRIMRIINDEKSAVSTKWISQKIHKTISVTRRELERIQNIGLLEYFDVSTSEGITRCWRISKNGRMMF